MIPFDFEYYAPETVEEATGIYGALQNEGKNPMYYGGGTEIISMARVGNIFPGAVIDIKKIPECRTMGTDGGSLVLGSAVTLSEIVESRLFPALALAAGRVADHTVQVKVTLGGNIAGTIYYHEAMLPLMISGCVLHIAFPGGRRDVLIADALSREKRLAPGELIVSFRLNKDFTVLPHAHIKRVKIEKTGYPLVTLSAVNADGVMRLSVSGLFDYPFRFADLPLACGHSPAALAEQLLAQVPNPVLDNVSGSAKYREFMFKKTAENIIAYFNSSGGADA